MAGPARKKARKEKPSASDGATQSNENILDPSPYLLYDILRIIFQYLNARDLANAARVCRSWLEAANNEKLTRGPCSIVKSLYDFNRGDFSKDLENLKIKPSFGFCFNPIFLESPILTRHMDLEELVKISKQCDTIMSYTFYGTFIMPEESDKDYSTINIIFTFLPQIPNVSIKSFKLFKRQSIRETAVYREVLSTIANHKSMPSYETSTCFLVFCSMSTYEKGCYWQSVIRESIGNEIVSVCSLLTNIKFISRIHVSNSSKCKKQTRMENGIPRSGFCPFGILITGSIQMWSTILKKDCITEESIEAKLKLFKDEVKLKKRSVAFGFTCYRHRRTINHGPTVDTTIFERLFPKVPYIDFSVNCNKFEKPTTVSEVNKEKKNIKKECKSKNFSICTVFLVLTW